MSNTQKRLCSSCKKDVTNLDGTCSFKCPACGEWLIIRCKSCRKIAARYICEKCGFSGPN
ncbi:MAG: zinc finger domain-containing protein [Candidatus Woesearchaeota archaeon]